jgi:hypothetical protein
LKTSPPFLPTRPEEDAERVEDSECW